MVTRRELVEANKKSEPAAVALTLRQVVEILKCDVLFGADQLAMEIQGACALPIS